ncbi:hypothetical protein C3N85_24420 [Salmonella enterica subsp. enterica serovar Morehead]|nr:hypothetical protein [Salmonella enterica subsp. enterica serovar Morehead]
MLWSVEHPFFSEGSEDASCNFTNAEKLWVRLTGSLILARKARGLCSICCI